MKTNNYANVYYINDRNNFGILNELNWIFRQNLLMIVTVMDKELIVRNEKSLFSKGMKIRTLEFLYSFSKTAVSKCGSKVTSFILTLNITF